MEAEGIWRTLVLGSLGLGSAHLRRAWNWSSTFSWTIWVSPCMNFPVFRGGGYTEASPTFRGASIMYVTNRGESDLLSNVRPTVFMTRPGARCLPTGTWYSGCLDILSSRSGPSHITHRDIDNKIHKYEIYIKDNNCKFIIYYIFLLSRLRLFHFSNVLPWFPEFL